VQETQARITRAEGELTQQLGRPPTAEEFADHLDATVRDVVEALAADGCFSPASLDRPLSSGEADRGVSSLVDLLGCADPEQPAAEARVALAPVVRRLKERDRQILYLRFFEQRTQQEIAADIGVTQMQVSRLLGRILRDLRRELTRPRTEERRVRRGRRQAS
jgi:RNA polymerase sigma-B factor